MEDEILQEGTIAKIKGGPESLKQLHDHLTLSDVLTEKAHRVEVTVVGVPDSGETTLSLTQWYIYELAYNVLSPVLRPVVKMYLKVKEVLE